MKEEKSARKEKQKFSLKTGHRKLLMTKLCQTVFIIGTFKALSVPACWQGVSIKLFLAKSEVIFPNMWIVPDLKGTTAVFRVSYFPIINLFLSLAVRW